MRQIFREDATIVAQVSTYFERLHAGVRPREGKRNGAEPPPRDAVARMLNAAFWASLRREEGWPTRLSLAYFAQSAVEDAFAFERPLTLGPKSLSKVAPAVERPGIHLGVWDVRGDLTVWGASLELPARCFVLEVVAPGVIVVKHPEPGAFRKYVNVAVLQGSETKILQQRGAATLDCGTVLATLLEEAIANRAPSRDHPAGVFVDLALSMRAHGRGGTIVVVPAGTDEWRRSVASPLLYAARAPFDELRRHSAARAATSGRRLQYTRAVDAVAGLTAVDGATVVTDTLDVLAFGAKLVRRDGRPLVESVLVSEAAAGDEPRREDPTVLGGTRHLSAGQFVHDHRDALALVASQDGRFTVFSWSTCDDAVHARRIDALLL
jgi:hypothetical protein